MMVKECALDNDAVSDSGIGSDKQQRFKIKVTPNGTVVIDWWCPEVDPLLDKLGVPDNDTNRVPWCG